MRIQGVIFNGLKHQNWLFSKQSSLIDDKHKHVSKQPQKSRPAERIQRFILSVFGPYWIYSSNKPHQSLSGSEPRPTCSRALVPLTWYLISDALTKQRNHFNQTRPAKSHLHHIKDRSFIFEYVWMLWYNYIEYGKWRSSIRSDKTLVSFCDVQVCTHSLSRLNGCLCLAFVLRHKTSQTAPFAAPPKHAHTHTPWA